MYRKIKILYARFKSKLNKDATIIVVDTADGKCYEFKNGSWIKTFDIDKQETVRGKRSEYFEWFYDDNCNLNKEEIDAVIKPFIKRN